MIGDLLIRIGLFFAASGILLGSLWWIRRIIWRQQQVIEQYHILYENKVEGIFRATLDGVYVDLNPTLARIYGYETPADLVAAINHIGEDLYLDPRRWTEIQKRLQSHGVVSNFESQVYHKDGEIIWVSENLWVVEDDQSEVQYYQGTVIEVTERKAAEESLRVQKQLLESLVAVARATSERPTLDDTLKNTLTVTSSLTGAEYGSLFLLNKSGEVIHKLTQPELVNPSSRQSQTRHIMDQGLAGWVANRLEPGLVYDTETDPRWLRLAERRSSKARSALAVPISSNQVLLGILTLTHSSVNHFNLDHVRLLQAAADQMALALRNAQIFDALRHTAALQITLYEVMRAMANQTEPAGVLKAAVDTITQFVGWSNIGGIIFHQDSQEWELNVVGGLFSGFKGKRFSVETGIVGRAIRTRQTQVVSDVHQDPDYLSGHADIKSELAVPLKRGSKILGALNIESTRENDFDDDDIILVNLLAEAMALALDNARLYTETQARLEIQQIEHSRLQALINASRDGILLIGLDSRILVVNAPVLKIIGWPGTPDSWTGLPLSQALMTLRRKTPEATRLIIKEIRRLSQGDRAIGEGIIQVFDRYIEWLNLPVRVETKTIGRLLVLHDATEQQLVEQMREDLTHTMVHDLRNPISVIFTSLHVLEEMFTSLSPQQKRTLTVANKNTEKMLSLVDHILDVSRLEGQRMPLNLTRLSLEDVVQEALDAQVLLARERGLELQIKIPPALPPVMADPDLVGRVIQNLVGNAIKFAPVQGVIVISAKYTTTLVMPNQNGRLQGDYIVVSVSDTGPGVSLDLQQRIFQKFVTGRRPESGSGLGLAFCKLVVEAHQGHIWLESKPGVKTTFSFGLPLIPPNIFR